MVNELLKYYAQNKRDLPWRKSKDPYYIWISEIMCQQTRVDTVIPYYERFITKYPTIRDLASAENDELMKMWQGLGYYSRARNLQKAAQEIVIKHNGIFPDNYQDISSLPGIGAYTASAILAMAFDQPYAAVDGNFLRVFSRFFGDSSDIAEEKTKQNLRNKLIAVMPKRSGDFNQAVMDLGATICLPNEEPNCSLCPLKKECFAYKNNCWNEYPVSSKVTKVTNYSVSVFIINYQGKYVLRKREEVGLLSGLYEFPNTMTKVNKKELNKLFPYAHIQKEKEKTHHFSHQTWKMTPYVIKVENYDLKEGEFLVSFEEIISSYSVPKAFNQFFNLLSR